MDNERQQLIDRVFDAFAWRQRPGRIMGRDWESIEYERHLAGVAPRELTFASLEVYDGDHNVLLSLATPEGARYYLPSVVALCIEDWERADILSDRLIWQFRASPADGAVLTWPSAFNPFRDHGRRLDVPKWFLDAEPVRNRLMSGMTMGERQVLAEYFDFETRTCVRYFSTRDFIERRAAIAFLRGRPYAERLGARNAEENQALLDALAVLKRRLPEEFGGSRTQAVEAELRANLAGWEGAG